MADGQRLDLLLAHPGGLPISGGDPVDLSLGGSETAVVCMARALHRLGNRVTVSCVTGEPHECDGVEYLPAGRLEAARAGLECDILLAVRFFDVLRQPVAARMRGLWFHDMPSPEVDQAMRPALARSGFCLFLSRFHLEAYDSCLPGLARHALVTSNGIDFDALEEIRGATRKDGAGPRFLYASRPERGLAVLLQEIWPVLKRRLPEAELLVTTYSLGGLQVPPPVQEHYRLCDELIRRADGVHKIGPLTRSELWRELAAATAVLYPTDFPESSCMVALEAQALGIPIVTTGRFALAETVACRETLITEPWRSPAYIRAFVHTAVRLAEDAEFARQAQQAGLRHVTRESHSWDAIARSWQHLFQRLFQERFGKRKAGVLRRLLRDSDAEAARRLVALEPEPEKVFHPSDLAELASRSQAKEAELAAEPVWTDFPPDVLPPQLAETYRDLSLLLPDGEPAEILDVGCFAANLSLLFAKDRPWIRLTGVDGNPAAIETATRKASDLGLGARTRFLCLVDPHRNENGTPELAPRSHDVVLLCEVLDYFPDPVNLLEWAESRARKAVVGYTLHGPWEALTGERFRLWNPEERELRLLLGGKRGLELRYFRWGQTGRDEPLGGWLFRYEVAPENVPGGLDLEGKILRAPPLPRISVNILVKNEEAHIRRAVESLQEIADEVVIGDTGCTDLTIGILESMGFRKCSGKPARGCSDLRIVEVAFEDFSQARNALASHATGDYILWHDADEAMVNSSVLRGLVDFNEYFDAFGIEQRHLILDAHIDSDYPLRCFRPDTAEGPLRWYGCIHEQVELRLNESPRRILICPEVFVGHLGYLHHQLRSNKQFHRNLSLFLKDRCENPGRFAGYILGIRENLALATWDISQAGRMTGKAYRCLNYGFEIWHHHVRHLPLPYREVGFPFSRQILAVLARHGRTLRLTGTVPFQADFALEILPGDRPAPAGDRSRHWTFFADLDELRDEIGRRMTDLAEQHNQATELCPITLPLDLDSAPELRSWTLPPELFGLEPFR